MEVGWAARPSGERELNESMIFSGWRLCELHINTLLRFATELRQTKLTARLYCYF